MSLARSATCSPGVLGHGEPKAGGALRHGEPWDTGSPRPGEPWPWGAWGVPGQAEPRDTGSPCFPCLQRASVDFEE